MEDGGGKVDLGLRFALLGPMELADATGEGLQVPGPRQRVLLAALLLSANVPVSCDALAEAVWEGSPPPGAAATLRSHIKRLRQTLGPDVGARITARAPGYLIRVGQQELDVLRFEALCREAGAARRSARWAEVSAAATHALELWRGSPLLDVPSQMLRDDLVPGLEQMRLQALEDHAAAGLRLHQHERLVPELRELTAQHPLRERFHAQLMEALARTGRQAEALDAYRQARRVLVDKLGIEPGPELQLLQRRILAGDPALLAPPPQRDDTSATADRGPAATAVPRQLPAAVRHFTGRDAALAELTALLGAARTNEAAVVIAAVDGPPGVGKTALAVRWAHQVAAEFPDGQLYVNLQGFDPSGEIVQAQTAIRGFLDAFGVPSGHIPSSPQAQAGLYRSLLAGKRVLIVADNARDAAQVRPLLPGSPGCLMVVTSRARLTGLAAAEGAHLLTLGAMPAGEASELLACRVGAARATAESAAIDELVRLCGRLPLALTVAAARAAARPRMSLTALAAELANAAGPLPGLETRDPATDVRTVFSWSCQTLPDRPARMFRLLGMHPGADITVPAAAALADIPQDDARAALGTLAMANLTDEHAPGRFTLHDLLRAYAAEQAAQREPQAERLAAIQRVLDYYLYTSHAAALVLNPYRVSVPVLPPPRPGSAPERLDGHRQALAWFEAEQQVLLGCVSLAAETGSDACAWILPWAMTEFLDRRGHWHEWAALQLTALAAATRLGDLAGQATARRALATACIRLTDYRQAQAQLAACLRLHRQRGDRSGEAHARHSLGRVAEGQGRYADALRHDQQALGLFREAADQAGQALALNAIGWYHLLLGRPQQARTFCQQALTLYRETGRLVGQAQAWDSLGYAEHHLGRLDHATTCYQQALGIFRDLGELFGQADTLARLGDTRAAAEDLPAARDAWQQAAGILEDLHHPAVAQVRAKLRSAQAG
jgi:DNA-binding SARP family transcriptional activator/tetratricopeptide (TPR) repeat protein